MSTTLDKMREHWMIGLVTCIGTIVFAKWVTRKWNHRLLHQRINNYRLKITAKNSELKRTLLESNKEDEREVLVTKSRRSILAIPIQKLLHELKSDCLKPLEVLEAYMACALEATESKNCVCHFILEARDRAISLESVPKSERGPLHGLPISVKECFTVAGYDQTVGLSRFMEDPAEEDGVMVRYLKDLGAVPFCLTNLPQTMRSFGSSNPIFGITSHPQDDARSPGGSSSGEGCLLAMGGSILGVGNDGGGSLRIPAHFCGVVTLKTTSGRIFQKGWRSGFMGKPVGIYASAGFMSQTVEGAIVGMRALLENPSRMARMDSTVVPIPWNETLFNPHRKLRIGWFDDNLALEPVPSCKRAVKEAVDLLAKAGHHVEPFLPYDSDKVTEMYLNHFWADEGINFLPWLDRDIVDQCLESNMIIWKTNRWFRCHVLPYLVRIYSPILSRLVSLGHHRTSDMWVSVGRLEQYREEVMYEWSRRDLDVVIAPGFACPAPPLMDSSRLFYAGSGTVVNNLLDLPGGVVPITRVTEADTACPSSYPANRDSSVYSDLLYKLVRSGIPGSEGLPVGVQVIGKPWQEEMVLGAMKELERLRDEKKGMFKPIEL